MVNHPVDGGSGGHGVGEDVLPLGEDQVGGDARLAASADGVDLGRSMTLPAAGDPALTGLTVDRFLPGAKALVCVRFERPISDITPDVPVPVLSPNDLFSLLAAGRSS